MSEVPMTVEEALGTSIELEERVRDVYVEAAEGAENPESERFFRLMADEEQSHVDYLHSRLDKWTAEGTVSSDGLSTAVPSRSVIEEETEKLRGGAGGGKGRIEIEYLRKAHAVERETNDFYARMVEELPDTARGLFRRFLEIEDGHLALVQAQLDLAVGTGYWFDVREFNLEG
jgi:rubrerythrin